MQTETTEGDGIAVHTMGKVEIGCELHFLSC